LPQLPSKNREKAQDEEVYNKASGEMVGGNHVLGKGYGYGENAKTYPSCLVTIGFLIFFNLGKTKGKT
jgi:hypothetical protein